MVVVAQCHRCHCHFTGSGTGSATVLSWSLSSTWGCGGGGSDLLSLFRWHSLRWCHRAIVVIDMGARCETTQTGYEGEKPRELDWSSLGGTCGFLYYYICMCMFIPDLPMSVLEYSGI